MKNSDTLRLSNRFILNGLKESLEYHCNSLLPYAASMSGIPEELFREKFLGATVTNHIEVNAKMEPNDDGRFEIKVSAPLMSFVWNCAKLWSMRAGVMKVGNIPEESPQISLEETSDRTQCLLNLLWDKKVCDSAICPISRLSSRQVVFAELLLALGERFIIAHEFGHAIIHMSPSTKSESILSLLNWSEKWARFYLNEILEKSKSLMKSQEVIHWDIDKLERHWGEEFSADVLGTNMTLCSAYDVKDSISGLWAIEALLVMFHMVESHCNSQLGYDLPLNSHPYSKLRLAIVRSAIRDCSPKNIKGVWEVGQFFEQLGDEIITQCNS